MIKNKKICLYVKDLPEEIFTSAKEFKINLSELFRRALIEEVSKAKGSTVEKIKRLHEEDLRFPNIEKEIIKSIVYDYPHIRNAIELACKYFDEYNKLSYNTSGLRPIDLLNFYLEIFKELIKKYPIGPRVGREIEVGEFDKCFSCNNYIIESNFKTTGRKIPKAYFVEGFKLCLGCFTDFYRKIENDEVKRNENKKIVEKKLIEEAHKILGINKNDE